VSLIEAVAGAAIVSIVAVIALAATISSARVATSPVARDETLAAARNAIVEARAAAAYDDGAVAAILAAQPSSWTEPSGTRFESTIEDGALLVRATSTGATARVRYPVVREALPQGTIVDLTGRPLGP
jgi:type II secretory pathway pseudopilin PulG